MKNGRYNVKIPRYNGKRLVFSRSVLNISVLVVWPAEGAKTILGPATRPRVGYRPEYFFSGSSIDKDSITVEKQAPGNGIRSDHFIGA